ncbi:MAG: tRNA dihydrouridine synthase DusB [Gammaproteobacteria bacterium]|nr:tRNA dihydrouridine synthase DusB [Gammaproteobacteria bacterium]
MKIGSYELPNNLILAPMAGVTDWPFRQLCMQLGAGMVVSEMMHSDPEFRDTQKSVWRATHNNEATPRAVQIAGGDPLMMAEAAKYNVSQGAQIIDINMGCPAKKVCKLDAGSALLKNEPLVRKILEAVVNAVNVPVTLKIRTGWDPENRNGIRIAQIAEQSGVAALAVHGRTRAERFTGEAEYDTIKAIKATVKIPVIANGDISTAEKAKQVLDYTQADAIMLGRAAQGNPWIFREINHFLTTGEHLAIPSHSEVKSIMCEHLENLYSLYGNFMGVRIARKHIGWYLQEHENTTDFCRFFNGIETPDEQIKAINQLFN